MTVVKGKKKRKIGRIKMATELNVIAASRVAVDSGGQFLSRGVHARPRFLSRRQDLFGRQQETERSGIAQLQRERVLDSGNSFGPVQRAPCHNGEQSVNNRMIIGSNANVQMQPN